MKNILFLVAVLLLSATTMAQGVIESYVISVDNGKVNLDITKPKVKVGDVLSIYKDNGYMVHPVTKKKIRKEPVIMADLEVIEVYAEYSVATVYPEEAIKDIKAGMVAEMPELPEDFETESEAVDADVVDAVEDKDVQKLPATADGIIQRYLRVTGLEKWTKSGRIPPFSKKEQLSYVAKNGKTGSGSYYVASDFSSNKLYVKYDMPNMDNFWNVYSCALAVNGDVGWYRFKKMPKGLYVSPISAAIVASTVLKGTLRTKDIAKVWVSCKDAFGLQLFDKSVYDCVSAGSKVVGDKQCTGVRFVDRSNPSAVSVVYYDNATGLEVCSEAYFKGKLVRKATCLEYSDVDGMYLCSKYVVKESKGKIAETTFTLEELCMDCEPDNSLFTKKAVYNAFKEK